jgi:hypothetical protein
MPLTKATTNVVNLDKDTTINELTVGKGSGTNGSSTAFGILALSSNTTGENNTGIGYNALDANTSGSNNTAVGTSALANNINGFQNVSVGTASLVNNSSGSYNTAVGSNALFNNTTGTFNTAVGSDALFNNTTGNSNTACGAGVLAQNTTGIFNTGMGESSLAQNTIGTYNTAYGFSSLRFNVGGEINTAIGSGALQNNTTGSGNTAVGVNALQSNTTGNNNTAVGLAALSSNTTYSNVGGFGYNAQVSDSNQIRIGDSNITSVTCQTNAWSDERDKADIRDTVLGLDFIKELRPVDFKWDYREDYRPEAPASVMKPVEPKEDASDEDKAKYAQELAEYNAYVVLKNKWLEDCKWSNLIHNGTHKRTRFHHGLIAQEVKSVIEKTGVDFGGFQDHTIKGGDAVMTIGYTELIGPLIKAVQELSAKVAALEAK